MDYDWPGNVRELEMLSNARSSCPPRNASTSTCSRKYSQQGNHPRVRLQLSEFLPPLPGEPGSRSGADHSLPSLFQIMDEIERRIIIDMLERTA